MELVRGVLCSPSVVLKSPAVGYGVHCCSHMYPYHVFVGVSMLFKSSRGLCIINDEQSTPVRSDRLPMLTQGRLSTLTHCRMHELAADVFPWGHDACRGNS